MKRIILLMIVLTSIAGCLMPKTEEAFAPDATAEKTAEEKDLQTLKDLGLPPKTILQMVRQELQRLYETNTCPPSSTSEQAALPPEQTDASRQASAVEAAATVGPAQPSEEAPQPVVPQQTEAQTAPAVEEPAQAQQPALPQAQAPAAVAAPALQTVVVTAQSPTVVIVNSPEIGNIDYFHQALAPYGSWIQLPGYGWVWQPTAAVVDGSWRPYCHGGNWIWTDQGWYWSSSYSWGWMPFHYGRWVFSAHHRWVWVPDTVWAPAWVCWRYSPTCFGWAPLPPEARYTVGVGFAYHGDYSTFDFYFGLSDWHYVFVPCDRFMDHDYRPVMLCRRDVERIYHDTHVVDHSYDCDGDRIIHTGLPNSLVANATGRSIPCDRIVRHRVNTSDASTAGGGSVVSGTLNSQVSPSRRTSGLRNAILSRTQSGTTPVRVTRSVSQQQKPAVAAPQSAPVAVQQSTDGGNSFVRRQSSGTATASSGRSSRIQAIALGRTRENTASLQATATRPAKTTTVNQPAPKPASEAAPRVAQGSGSNASSGQSTAGSTSSTSKQGRSSRLQELMRKKMQLQK